MDCNGHLRGPVTPTSVAERFAVELSLQCTCFYDVGLSRLGFKHPTFQMLGERSNRLRHRPSLKVFENEKVPS